MNFHFHMLDKGFPCTYRLTAKKLAFFQLSINQWSISSEEESVNCLVLSRKRKSKYSIYRSKLKVVRVYVNMTVKLKTSVDLAASSHLKTFFFQKWIWAPVVTSRKYEPLLRLGIGGKAKKGGGESGNVIVVGEAKWQRLSPGKWKGKSVSENSWACGSLLLDLGYQ